MLYSYENSCFCFVLIYLPKVLRNYWVPYQKTFFLSTSRVILHVLTGLISKACWPFTSKKDLTHVIWYPYYQIRYYIALNQHDLLNKPICNIHMICEHKAWNSITRSWHHFLCNTFYVFIYPKPSLKLERTALKIRILWSRTDISSCKLSAKVFLMLHNSFPV